MTFTHLEVSVFHTFRVSGKREEMREKVRTRERETERQGQREMESKIKFET